MAFTRKPLNRKTFYVVMRSPHNPHSLLDAFWTAFGNHDFREVTRSSKIVTHIEVRGSDLHMLVDYTVRGGHPADLRRWIGKLVWGDADGGAQLEIAWKETVRLDGLRVDPEA